MPKETLVSKDQTVQSLGSALYHGGANLQNVPGLTTRVIESDAWKCRVVEKLGNKLVKFDSFEEFVTTEPLEGLGESMEALMRACRDDPAARTAIDSVTGNRQGQRSDLVDNINEVVPVERPTGTSKQQALRRLKKDAPELLQKVLDGELSAHRAMVTAGFRKVPTPLQRTVTAYSKLTDEERLEFRSWLEENGKD